MRQWHPAPRAMIDDELMRQWTRDNPAPDLVVHMVLISRMLSGNPWGRTKLAGWSGLTKHAATKAIKDAQRWVDEWKSGTFQPVDSQQHGHPPRTIPDSYGDESGGTRAELGRNSGTIRHHARGITSTPTTQNTTTEQEITGETPAPPPLKQSRGKKIGTEEARHLWAMLNARRQRARQGSRPLKLTPATARALVDGLKYAKPAEILHAFEYFLTAEAARWWRDRDIDLGTFIRPKHLGNFVNAAQDWTPEIEAQQQAEADNVIPF